MTIVCPTIMAGDPHDYRDQVERVQSFAKRLHIDVVDGHFATNKTISLSRIWWPPDVVADVHMMYRRPLAHLPLLIRLRPHLVIIHAEADVDHVHFAKSLRRVGIRAGLAITHDTPVGRIHRIIRSFDHILVFGGRLSYHSKETDMRLLDSVKQIREVCPKAEIGWDGGINATNVKRLADGGVDVLNVGGFLQTAREPAAAYSQLSEAIRG